MLFYKQFHVCHYPATLLSCQALLSHAPIFTYLHSRDFTSSLALLGPYARIGAPCTLYMIMGFPKALQAKSREEGKRKEKKTE